MNYEELFYLKFVKDISTCNLMKRYPQRAGEVGEIALLDLPLSKWEEFHLIKDRKRFMRLLQLRRKFLSDPNFESY